MEQLHAAGTMEGQRQGVTREPVRSGRRARFARVAYLVLAWLLVASIAYQVFLAGMAVFVDPINWARHVQFVHLFEMLPVLLLGLAFAGRMPKKRGLYLGPILLFALLGLQHAFAGAGRSVVAALHPVNALVIFWGGVVLAQRAGRAHRENAEG